MFRTALAAATLAAIAATASSAFAQSAEGIRNLPGLNDQLAGRITIRPDRVAPAAGDVAPRIALNPDANNGPREELEDRQIVVTPREDNPPVTQQIVINPGNGEQNDPPTQQIVIDPGAGEQNGPTTPQVVVNPGNSQPNPPVEVVVNPPADRPDRPVLTERPPLDQGQPAIDLVEEDVIEESAPARPETAAAPETATAELPEPWEIQFNLVREGFRNIHFVEKNDSYYFLTAEPENYRGLTYLMAVDLTGKVVSVRELRGYRAEAHDRYEAPRYEAPRYEAPRYEPPRYSRYSAPRYSRIVADEHCDEYGRPRY